MSDRLTDPGLLTKHTIIEVVEQDARRRKQVSGGIRNDGGQGQIPGPPDTPSDALDYTPRSCYANDSTVSGFAAGEFTDGTRDTWTLPSEPMADSLFLFVNGLYIHEGVHYTRSGASITLSQPPFSGDELCAKYAEKN
jgi:hypothetical protein